MIDWKRVAELRAEIGDADFAEVVELFIEEVEALIGRLKANPDPSRYEEDLHFLKGCAVNLGFAALAGQCFSGETMAVQGNADKVDLAAILDCYEASKSEFFRSDPLLSTGS